MICDPQNLIIFLSSKKLEKEAGDWKKAPYYNTLYEQKPISDELLQLIKNPLKCEMSKKKLDLPPKNNMIAKNFNLLDFEKSLEPRLI
jgi:secreted Zn-dependent insulinase-like peptidase